MPYISQYITLKPGDVIFTGTPGNTQAMEVGDVIEIEVEGGQANVKSFAN